MPDRCTRPLWHAYFSVAVILAAASALTHFCQTAGLAFMNSREMTSLLALRSVICNTAPLICSGVSWTLSMTVKAPALVVAKGVETPTVNLVLGVAEGQTS